MDYDEVVSRLGKVGRFERLLVLALAIPCILNAPPNLGIVFVAGVQEHRCRVLGLEQRFNLSEQQLRQLAIPLDGDTYSSCMMYGSNYSSWTEADVATALDKDQTTRGQNESAGSCRDGWTYDQSQYESTIVSEWDLVCDDQWMRATVASVFYAGMMAGVSVFGMVSDLIGRKKCFCITALLKALVSLMSAWSPNYTTFVILRFFVAMFSSASYTNSFVMTIETVAPTWRVHASITGMYMWSVGYMATALTAYLIRDWFTLQLVIGVSSCLVLPYIWFLPESPRWLYIKNRREEGDKTIRRIAKFNNVELPEKLEVSIKQEKSGYLWDVFRTPRLRCRFINLFFNWCIISLVYYGLSLNTSNLGGNDYMNFFIAGAVEVPAYVCSQLAMSYLGRRLSLTATWVLGGLALFAILITPEDMTWVVIFLGMTGKFAITISYAVIYVYTAELSPTGIRNVGVGAGSFFARVGAIIAPFIADAGSTNKVLPPIIFGSLSMAAGLLTLLLPETKGKHLPETLADGESFGKNSHLCQGLCALGVSGNSNVVEADGCDKATDITKLTNENAAAATDGKESAGIMDSLMEDATAV